MPVTELMVCDSDTLWSWETYLGGSSDAKDLRNFFLWALHLAVDVHHRDRARQDFNSLVLLEDLQRLVHSHANLHSLGDYCSLGCIDRECDWTVGMFIGTKWC
jgi:hypothetical protein